MDQIDTHRWPNTFDARPDGRRPAAPVFARPSSLRPPRPPRPPRQNPFRYAVLPPQAPFPPDLGPTFGAAPAPETPRRAAARAPVRRPARRPATGRNHTHTAVIGGMLAGLFLICALHALSHFI